LRCPPAHRGDGTLETNVKPIELRELWRRYKSEGDSRVRERLADVVNKAINQTLSRTILTSGLTFLTVLVLFLLGGSSLRAFSFAMVVGIVVGTYSSFGIAAPMVVAWYHWRDQKDQKADVGAGSLAGSRGRP